MKMVRIIMAMIVMVECAIGELRPCLSDKMEFMGYDTFGRTSYNAVDFTKKLYGLKRPGISKMVKDFSGNQAKRYDVTPDNCTVSDISSTPDIPQCVPDSAKKVPGPAWEVTNVDGATLYYKDTQPSVLLLKLSPDKENSVSYGSWKTEITDPNIFIIPSRCH